MRLLAVFVGCFVAANGKQCLQDAISRFECAPEVASVNYTQVTCEKRGCCWQNDPNAVADSPAPKCFYPIDYSGYVIADQKIDDKGVTAHLKRNTPSGVDVDITDLLVSIVAQNDQTVRIKITDASKGRWEPPLPKIPDPSSRRSKDYGFSIEEKTQRLEVHRMVNNKPTLKIVSFNLGTLVYTDRFLQITNQIETSNIYGLGERKGKLKRSMNYTTFSNFNKDHIPEIGVRPYGTHPFYINIEADGSANGVWFFNSNYMDILLQPTPAITYRTLGGVLDFFVFIGPKPADVVRQYLDIVGKPVMIPYWALGFQLCRWGYQSVKETQDVLQRNLDAGVRIEVQWHDIDYMERHNDFTIDPVNFRDLPGFVDKLHNDGRRYVLILDPAVSGSEAPGTYPPYDRGMDYDIFMRDATGKHFLGIVWNDNSSIFPDFTHPNATAYWTEMFQLLHNKVNFDGAWIDMNEPANMIEGHLNEGCPHDEPLIYVPNGDSLQTKTLCLSDQHYWTSHYNMHNMYGFTEAIATYNALQTILPNKRPLIISRSTFSGQGVYSNHWTGDVVSSWDDLRDSVSGFLEYSFYGLPYVGADICGFVNDTTIELCSRWHAVGAFYPFSRNHNTLGAKAQDPAALGDDIVLTVNNAFYWRYKLMPYLYTQFYYAHVNGDTVTRPLFFEYPQDQNTYDNDEQFFWGDSLMVVPALYEGQKFIDAYFPEGVWYDLQNNSRRIDAGQGMHLALEARQDTVQFFIRGGSALFYQEPEATTAASRNIQYGLIICLDNESKATGTMYVDDGESLDSVTSSRYEIIQVTASDTDVYLRSSAPNPTGLVKPILEMFLHGVKTEPKTITIGREQAVFSYDNTTQLLSVYFQEHDPRDFSLTIQY